MASSDAFALVVGERGGWKTPSGRFVIEEEYDEAVRRGIPLYVFLHEVDRDAETKRFVRRVSDYVHGTFRRGFNNPEELQSELQKALAQRMRIFWTFCNSLLLAIVLELGIQACASSTGTLSGPSMQIVTREDTVLARIVGSCASFVVTVVARNQGGDSVNVSACRAAAQRLINGQWVTVYQPVCTGVGPFFKLGPGDSAVFPMTVSSFA